MVDDAHAQDATDAHNSTTSVVAVPLVDPASQLGVGLLPADLLSHVNNTTGLIIRTSAANGTSESDKLHRAPFSTMFPASKKSVSTPLISQDKFHWDQKEQGHILGAFFYGYILFQIPGARMAEQIGAKWILLAANAGSALISLLFPLSTQLNSIHLLMALRFVMGLCQSAFFPAAYVLFCRWLPEKERAVLLPVMFIGSNMGNISTYIMSSYLITSTHGWPSVFYVSGFVCTVVTILWCVFGSNGPEDNLFITDEERHYIKTNVSARSSKSNSFSELDELQSAKRKTCELKQADQQHRLTAIPERVSFTNGLKSSSDCKSSPMRKSASYCGQFDGEENGSKDLKNGRGLIAEKNLQDHARSERYASLVNAKTSGDKQMDKKELEDRSREGCLIGTEAGLSWCKLLKSIPVWTLIFSMYGNEWSNVVICFELPTYLNTALNYPIEQNGVINSFFQLSYTLASPIISSLGAYMLNRHVLGMRKIHVRKLFQSLSTFGQLACYVSVPICGANRGLIIMFMFSAVVFKACANAGDIMVPGDLSPEYAGTIFAFANSIGNTAGFLVPLLAGALVFDAHKREQWTPFWLTTAAIMGSSGLIFLFFGETSIQDFSPDSNQGEEAACEEGAAKGTKTADEFSHRFEAQLRPKN